MSVVKSGRNQGRRLPLADNHCWRRNHESSWVSANHVNVLLGKRSSNAAVERIDD